MKDIIKKMEGQATDWGHIFAKPITDRGLVNRIEKRTLKTQVEKENPITKMDKIFTHTFTKTGIQMANTNNTHLLKCLKTN